MTPDGADLRSLLSKNSLPILKYPSRTDSPPTPKSHTTHDHDDHASTALKPYFKPHARCWMDSDLDDTLM